MIPGASCVRAFRLEAERSADPVAGVAEEFHPRGIVAPFFGCPAHARAAEDALGMRHHNRHATIGRGERCDAVRRAVGVERIGVGYAVVIIHEARAHESGIAAGLCGIGSGKLGTTFAVGDDDGNHGTGHVFEEDTRARLDFE